MKTIFKMMTTMGLTMTIAACGNGLLDQKKTGQKTVEQVGISNDASSTNPITPVDAPTSDSELQQELSYDFNIIDVDAPFIKENCRMDEEEDDDEGTGSVRLNENNLNESILLDSDSIVLIEGNRNQVDVQLNSEEAISSFCNFVNGNNDIVNISIEKDVKEIFIGVDGNANEITLKIPEGVQVENLYRYTDAASKLTLKK